ncbi:MAG TPA: methyltransferase domain-containing protein [Acidimicrobiales bacterium]|nr:methyltransferase domain-containing protein [Acidimicrobiales bacterium]
MEFVYDLTVDPDAENNTHAFALEMIGHNKTVLEVGCATGYFTKVLAERGCKVVGMEIDPEAAKVAEGWAERVVVGNVDDTEVWDRVDDETFDVVTFGDVLEHLRDPLAVLRVAVRKLKPFGCVVISLPNVAHGDVRLSLLHGDFRYQEIGLLDRTHIRFFTLQTARELLQDAGLVAVDTRRVVIPLFDTELGVSRDDFPEAVLDEVRADPEFETYQFVMKSVLDNGSQAVVDMAHRLDQVSDRAHELEVRNRILEEQVLHLADYAELREEHARVGEQLEAWIAHAGELTQWMEQLRGERDAATARAVELATATDALRADLEATQQQLEAIRSSRSYALMQPVRRLRAILRGGQA